MEERGKGEDRQGDIGRGGGEGKREGEGGQGGKGLRLGNESLACVKRPPSQAIITPFPLLLRSPPFIPGDERKRAQKEGRKEGSEGKRKSRSSEGRGRSPRVGSGEGGNETTTPPYYDSGAGGTGGTGPGALGKKERGGGANDHDTTQRTNFEARGLNDKFGKGTTRQRRNGDKS